MQLTSSLTLSVLGIVKELCTILLAGAVRGEQLSASNLGGFGVVSLGALLYHASKHTQAHSKYMVSKLPRQQAHARILPLQLESATKQGVVGLRLLWRSLYMREAATTYCVEGLSARCRRRAMYEHMEECMHMHMRMHMCMSHVHVHAQAAGKCLSVTASAPSRCLSVSAACYGWARSFWVRLIDEEPSANTAPSTSTARGGAPPAVSLSSTSSSAIGGLGCDARRATDRL